MVIPYKVLEREFKTGAREKVPTSAVGVEKKVQNRLRLQGWNAKLGELLLRAKD
jgi:hypothetical protein